MEFRTKTVGFVRNSSNIKADAALKIELNSSPVTFCKINTINSRDLSCLSLILIGWIGNRLVSVCSMITTILELVLVDLLVVVWLFG